MVSFAGICVPNRVRVFSHVGCSGSVQTDKPPKINTFHFHRKEVRGWLYSVCATPDAQYEKGQTELTAEISALEKAIRSYEKHEKDADRFIALIDKYENFDKLTIAMLNEFVEKILVHERDRKGSIQTTQEVEIRLTILLKSWASEELLHISS